MESGFYTYQSLLVETWMQSQYIANRSAGKRQDFAAIPALVMISAGEATQSTEAK